MTIGSNIKYYREARNYNQTDLAKMLGVTPQSVQQWESCATSPKHSRLMEIANCLGVTVSDLITEKEHAIKEEPTKLGRLKIIPVGAPPPTDNVYILQLPESHQRILLGDQLVMTKGEPQQYPKFTGVYVQRVNDGAYLFLVRRLTIAGLPVYEDPYRIDLARIEDPLPHESVVVLAHHLAN